MRRKIRCSAIGCKHRKGLFCQLDKPDNANEHFCLDYEEEATTSQQKGG